MSLHAVVVPDSLFRVPYGASWGTALPAVEGDGRECAGRAKSASRRGAAWRILAIVAIATAMASGGCASSPRPPRAAAPAGDVRGCWATYLPTQGSFRFEPFLKVADKESLTEDGQPEVWGFRPWNLEPPDANGKTRPVNIPEAQWIPMGEFKEVPMSTSAHTKKIRCPEGLWR